MALEFQEDRSIELNKVSYTYVTVSGNHGCACVASDSVCEYQCPQFYRQVFIARTSSNT
jgi:hypothetical protein